MFSCFKSIQDLGLKCSAWKRLCLNYPKLMQKKFWVPKIFIKSCGSKKIGSEKIMSLKNILGQKNIMGPKKLWVKIFVSEKYFESKIFGLPPFPAA